MWRDRMFVNVASAGLPKDGDPRAHYAILTQQSGGWSVRSRRVAFDVDKVERQTAQDAGCRRVAERIAMLRRHRYKQLAEPPALMQALEIDRLGETLRRLHRRRRHLARRPRGRVLRLARPQRRGQDDDDQRRSSGWRRSPRARSGCSATTSTRDWRAARRTGRACRRRNTTSTATSTSATSSIYQAGYYGLRGRAIEQRADELLERFGLTSKAKQVYTRLSGGMKRRLTIARALMLRAAPADPRRADGRRRRRAAARAVGASCAQLNRDGTTIILTTHYLEEAEELCSRIGDHRGRQARRARKDAQKLIGERTLQDVFLELTRR